MRTILVSAATLVVGIAIGIWYSNTHMTTQTTSVFSNYDRQKDCAQQAEAAFNYYVVDATERNSDEFTSYFNQNLGKCFVLITYPVTSTNHNFGESLFDAVERKQYGSFVAGAPLETPLDCEMLTNTCSSQREFDSFVKTYME